MHQPFADIPRARMLYLLFVAIQRRNGTKPHLRVWLLYQTRHPLIIEPFFNYRGCWVAVPASSVVCRLPPAAAVPAHPPRIASQAVPSGGLGAPRPAGGGLSSSSSLGQFRSDCTSCLGAWAFAGLTVMVGGDGVAIAGDDLQRQRIPGVAPSLGFWPFWNVKKPL